MGIATDKIDIGGSELKITQFEVDLGNIPKKSGRFSITTTNLDTNKHIIINQATGAYTGKGTLADEAEMDTVSVTGKITSNTNIDCYWTSNSVVKGNFKFNILSI